MVIEFEESN